MIVGDNFGLRYALDSINRTAKIISLEEKVESIVIQRSINYQFINYLITEVENGAFAQNTKIKSISFVTDSAVTTIGEEVFELSSVSSLTLPSSVENLKRGWCEEANNLVNIKISPNNKRYIYFDDKMILGKSDLSTDTYDDLIFVRRDATDVKIPSFVKHIDYSCFDGCSRIETLTFGDDSELRSIRRLAFANSSIKKLTIPSKFETFEEGWCEDSIKLNEIIVSKENPNFITDENHFVLGKSSDAKESTVFDILYFAPRKIKKVRIPSFVKHLSSYAFDQCSKIESFEFEENSELVSIGYYCFFECNFTKISFPSSLKTIKSYAFSCSSIEKVDFGENSELTTIENCVFDETTINKIVLPASLKFIGNSSFSCELYEIQFEKNSKLESIGCNCFSECSITHVSIPSSINFIDHGAFENCELLVIAEILDDEKEKTVNLYNDSFYGTSEDFVLFVPQYIKLVISNEDKHEEDYD